MPKHPMRIAYIMSRFPKLSETFVLYEMLAVEEQGAAVEIFPLLREKQRTVHPEAQRLMTRAHYTPFLSGPVLVSNLRMFVARPLAYLGTLFAVLWHTFGSFNFFFGALGIFPKAVHFARKMERLGIQHIHAHFANHPTVAAYIASRLTGIPFSFTAHGSDLHVERRMLKQKIAACRFAITISEFNREMMARECGPELAHKIAIVHCGVDREVFAPSPREAASPSSALLRILCVASFEEVKGHRFLVEACRLLQERNVKFLCQMVGEGPQRAAIESQIRAASLAGAVQVLDGQPRREVARLLREADVFVLASHPTASGKKEGIPVALMEAMAAGLPVVASRTGGIPELVRDRKTGLLTPPGDARAIADAIEELAAAPAARSWLGAHARKYVLAEFDLRTNAQRLLAMMEKGSAAGKKLHGREVAELPHAARI